MPHMECSSTKKRTANIYSGFNTNGGQNAIHKLNGEIVNMATDLSVGEGILGLQACMYHY